MMRKSESKPDDPEQSKRFIDTAREIGADETKEGARRAFKKVITASPSHPSPTPKASAGKRSAAK